MDRQTDRQKLGLEFYSLKARLECCTSSNKATPSNLSNPFKQLHTLVTKPSTM